MVEEGASGACCAFRTSYAFRTSVTSTISRAFHASHMLKKILLYAGGHGCIYRICHISCMECILCVCIYTPNVIFFKKKDASSCWTKFRLRSRRCISVRMGIHLFRKEMHSDAEETPDFVLKKKMHLHTGKNRDKFTCWSVF